MRPLLIPACNLRFGDATRPSGCATLDWTLWRMRGRDDEKDLTCCFSLMMASVVLLGRLAKTNNEGAACRLESRCSTIASHHISTFYNSRARLKIATVQNTFCSLKNARRPSLITTTQTCHQASAPPIPHAPSPLTPTSKQATPRTQQHRPAPPQPRHPQLPTQRPHHSSLSSP